MLEDKDIDTLKRRYNNLMKFNNSLMDKLLSYRDMLEDDGRNLSEITWCYESYDECYYRKDEYYNCKDKESYIEACKSIDSGIDVMLQVLFRTTMALRTYLPVNKCLYCKCKVKGEYSFSAESWKPFCEKCNKQSLMFEV